MMILSTAPTRTIPFLEIFYTSLTTVLGNLSSVCNDNLNVPHLILVKFMNILKVNVRTYRDIRKIVLTKQKKRKELEMKKRKRQQKELKQKQKQKEVLQLQGQNQNHSQLKRISMRLGSFGTGDADDDFVSVSGSSGNASGIASGTNSTSHSGNGNGDGGNSETKDDDIKSLEIAIVREYLLQGKLHRAITFGMDVPGLLFGDAKGQECPIPSTHCEQKDGNGGKEGESCSGVGTCTGTGTGVDEDAILEQRLFGNGRRILHECELDYNRILSHRVCRILFPRADFASPVLRSACVELLASMIMTPIMGCFTPDYLNGWIKTAIVGKDPKPDGSSENASASADDNQSPANTNNDDKNRDEFGEDGEEQGGSGNAREKYGGLRHSSVSIDTAASGLEDLEEEDEEDDIELEAALVVGTSIDDQESFDVAENVVIESHPSKEMDTSNEILALLAMSLIELQAHIDFDEARAAKANGEQLEVRWSDQGCVETIRNLVLVIEAMLMHGVLLKRRKKKIVLPPPDLMDKGDAFSGNDHSAATVPELKAKEYPSVTVMLMEMTSDLESFENELANADGSSCPESMYEEDDGDIRTLARPKAGDLSTLRYVIAAWFHNGFVFRTLQVLISSESTLLHPFYHKDAFIRQRENMEGFLRQLKALQNVDILVDTLTILSHPPLDLFQMEDQRIANEERPGFFPATSSVAKKNVGSMSRRGSDVDVGAMTSSRVQSKLKSKMQQEKKYGIGGSIKANFENNRKRLSRLVRPGEKRSGEAHVNLSPSGKKDLAAPKKGAFSVPTLPSLTQQDVPFYLEFHGNEALASSLRIEREARLKSFATLNEEIASSTKVLVEMICRSYVSTQNHRDLHNLAKGFYSNTTCIFLRHNRISSSGSASNENTEHRMLVMESVTTRRKLALPDDDSSFLLRAQPIQLNVVGVHRDQRSNNLSYKKYAAYFDEPIAHPQKNEFLGAKLRRKCFLRYYPNDRTGAINFIRNDRYLDSTLGRLIELETSGASKQIKEFERNLCNKSFRKGSERASGALSNSILTSNVMDSNDFSNLPRSGKASDFLYRISFLEEPEVELSGHRFIVQDAAAIGVHRADASSLEISDAALSASLFLGQNYDKRNQSQFHVKCDDRGVPVIYLKLANQLVDVSSPLSASSQRKPQDELRPYRLSFVRAALLITSARKEAQLQCLLTGSVKSATKSRTDKLLQPTLTLLDFATSQKSEREAILLRDLKLGINHIDRDQLRRTGLLCPRYPTTIRSLKVVIDGVVEVKSNQPLDLLGGPSSVLYQLRCTAITEYIGLNSEDNTDDVDVGYGDIFREEWTVLRPFRDFTAFHKFLKTQVNPTECSAGAGAKLTGLATAALTLGTSSQSMSKRKAMIPSLNKAVQAGALGATKKCIEKRKEILTDYLTHLLSKGNLLNRCPELLRFIGAYDPLPEEVKIGNGVLPNFTDALGRSDMSKTSLQRSKLPISIRQGSNMKAFKNQHTSNSDRAEISDNYKSAGKKSNSSSKRSKKKSKRQVDSARLAMLASIKARIDCVKLSQVRGSIFELIRYIFDLDSANFFRSQMVAAVKTMSMAFTSSHGFKRTLIAFHLKYLSSRSVASYIRFIKDLIWPNGIIFTPAKPLTREQSKELAKTSRELLQNVFPDQLMAVLGNDITVNGLDLFHEMINNRMVLKSMIYMMADTLLLEAFPEMRDVLTCSQVLDSAVG